MRRVSERREPFATFIRTPPLLRKNQIYARLSYRAIFAELWHDEQPIAGQAP